MRVLKMMVVAGVLAIAQMSAQTEAAEDCAVCVKLLTKVDTAFREAKKEADANKDKSFNAMHEIERIIDEKCAKTSTTEGKVCYHIKPIKRKVSQPMSNFMPPDRVCKKLKKESAEICAVREAVKIEKGVTDYNKLKIKDLKKILMDRGVPCTNCLEKADFVNKCKETEDLHDEL
eukprot:CAMPEP_0184523684 /NCGR_PEP_ID=MMETSP0198_2-20121128/9035_1 /TAXON_ID=1112570 /ORGANISM="Thraustochytrium sp., Strain LLF1b" /LENGTH=174 /DNA_ID=CAMNT_0026914771 /DNA_START=154 /DNA_END=678 /DNA_ORIENTATION=-